MVGGSKINLVRWVPRLLFLDPQVDRKKIFCHRNMSTGQINLVLGALHWETFQDILCLFLDLLKDKLLSFDNRKVLKLYVKETDGTKRLAVDASIALG
jgi:hypothetical protein